MGNIFGKEKDIKEVMRENERMIKRAVRELDREIASLERQQQKLAADIKKYAKIGQEPAAKQQAKAYVRIKNNINRFIMLQTQLKGMGLQMTTIKSSHAMGEALKGVTQALQKANKQLDLPSLNKIMNDFIKENDIQEAVQENMGEMLDESMAQEGDVEEEDKLISQVMDELGIEFASKLSAAPTGTPLGQTAPVVEKASEAQAIAEGSAPSLPSAPPTASAGGANLDDLEERLRNLRK